MTSNTAVVSFRFIFIGRQNNCAKQKSVANRLVWCLRSSWQPSPTNWALLVVGPRT